MRTFSAMYDNYVIFYLATYYDGWRTNSVTYTLNLMTYFTRESSFGGLASVVRRTPPIDKKRDARKDDEGDLDNIGG